MTSDVDYKACRTGTGSDALIVHVLIRADCDNPRCPGPAGSAGRLGPAADDGHRARRVS